ncbi:acyl-CoA thioesterase [Lentibacillus salinarum]|uniref:Acyl-CoA thioesterase n=1 Tax=Lentibacillus salinarum TaxID=446820 RepID=A0ABW3ZRG7_9BACI
MRKNSINLRVNWGDTDKAGIVYYPNFFKWFDIAGHQFFRDCNISPAYLEKEHNTIVALLDAQCTFENPILYDDIITIHTEVEKLTSKTIKFRHIIARGETVMGRGYEIRGWVKQSEHGIKTEHIPDNIRQVLEEDKHTTDSDQRPMLNA